MSISIKAYVWKSLTGRGVWLERSMLMDIDSVGMLRCTGGILHLFPSLLLGNSGRSSPGRRWNLGPLRFELRGKIEQPSFGHVAGSCAILDSLNLSSRSSAFPQGLRQFALIKNPNNLSLVAAGVCIAFQFFQLSVGRGRVKAMVGDYPENSGDDDRIRHMPFGMPFGIRQAHH